MPSPFQSQSMKNNEIWLLLGLKWWINTDLKDCNTAFIKHVLPRFRSPEDLGLVSFNLSSWKIQTLIHQINKHWISYNQNVCFYIFYIFQTTFLHLLGYSVSNQTLVLHFLIYIHHWWENLFKCFVHKGWK